MSQFPVELPEGQYGTMRINLNSGRVAVVVLPSDLTNDEIDQLTSELAKIHSVVAGWYRP
jgi:hypothetical protein